MRKKRKKDLERKNKERGGEERRNERTTKKIKIEKRKKGLE